MSPRPEAAPLASQLQAPRLATLWAAGVYVLATLSLAYPALGGAFLVNPRSDQFIAGYAFREFAAQTLKAGEGFPQWNPYLFGGMPYIAGMHGDIFYPTFLLRMILPTDVAMTWGFIIHIFLAGFFTFGFLRAWGVGFFGSLVGGLAYMMSGPIAAYVSPGHDGKLFVSTLFPLTLWFLVRGVRDGRPWAWGALAITIGMAVLSPHPQLLQYLLLASGSFALYLALSVHEGMGKLPRDVAVKRLGLALGAVIVGAVIGAIQYLPVREYVDWSPRAGGAGWAHAISYSLPTEELLNAFVPQFSGILEAYWGRNTIHLHSEYPGVAVLVLAGAGMFATARRSFRWFWIGVFVVSLLWALGGSTPFYRLVYAIVPGTKFFRAPSTMMYVSMFSLAVLAALGVERLLTAAQSMPRRFLWLWAGAVVLIGALMAMGLPTAVANSLANELSAAGWPPDRVTYRVDFAERNQGAVTLGVLRSIAFVFITLGLVWAAMQNRFSKRVIAWTLAAIVVIDLWSIERLYWRFSPSAEEIYASDAAIDAMRRAPEPGRVTAVDFTNSSADRDPFFFGAAWMTHGVRSIAGYHGNELGRYQQMLRQSSRVTDRDGLSQPFWRHENLHYLYTTLPDSLMPLLASQLGLSGQFTKIVGPVRNAAGSIIYLYRVPGENPAVWVATAMAKAADDEALATVLNPAFDQQRFAIVDPEADVPAVTLETLPPPAGVKASITRYEPREINVELDKPVAPGMALVVSENYFPGWRASASGQNATVFRANYNLVGVALPAGAREVQLRFSDPAYATGKTVTLIALVIATAALIAGIVIDRRRIATPQPVPAV